MPASNGRRRSGVVLVLILIGLFVSAVGAQVVLDGTFHRFVPERSFQWIRSAQATRRLALGFDSLAADIYWIRAVQHYGRTRLSEAQPKHYELLYPLLDITTTLDPKFNIAYRFGAILLSEDAPNGPGRPDEAIALLEKGIRASPERWEYYLDAGFVHYWWRRDARSAADWFLRGSALPGAPNWLHPLAASVLAEGGQRESARRLWTELSRTAEHDWLRQTAERRLLQLEAEEAIEQLQPIVNSFYDTTGRFPADWGELVRAGRLPGVPLDPSGMPYALDGLSGAVDVATASALYPLQGSRVLPDSNP
jgi:tetratricopeptide (TPR) repeat protein